MPVAYPARRAQRRQPLLRRRPSDAALGGRTFTAQRLHLPPLPELYLVVDVTQPHAAEIAARPEVKGGACARLLQLALGESTETTLPVEEERAPGADVE